MIQKILRLLTLALITTFISCDTSINKNMVNESTIKYIVTFNSNDGSLVASQEVTKDGLIIKPTDPEKQDFIFSGWYKESSLTTEWNFTTDKVSQNITLYAKWTVISQTTKYTVTFNSNGGSLVTSQEVTKDGLIVMPIEPTKNGYVFQGWFKGIDSVDIWNFATDKAISDTTLYAKWCSYGSLESL